MVLFWRRYWPVFKEWLRRFLWNRCCQTRWDCLEEEPGESWWSKHCGKKEEDPDAESLADKIRNLLCYARADPAKKKKKKKKTKKKVKKKKWNLVETSIVTFREPEESEEEEVVEQLPPGPSFMDKVMACFIKKPPAEVLRIITPPPRPPTPPVESEESEPNPFQTDHLAMLTGANSAPTQLSEPAEEEPNEAPVKGKKQKKKKVKSKKKKMKWVYVAE